MDGKPIHEESERLSTHGITELLEKLKEDTLIHCLLIDLITHNAYVRIDSNDGCSVRDIIVRLPSLEMDIPAAPGSVQHGSFAIDDLV